MQDHLKALFLFNISITGTLALKQILEDKLYILLYWPIFKPNFNLVGVIPPPNVETLA